jgi:formate hydrogenlyase subunit 7
MAEPLRRTLEAKPTPRLVIAVGDCALNCGALAGGYGVAGAVGDVVDVDLEVPGRPPHLLVAAVGAGAGAFVGAR